MALILQYGLGFGSYIAARTYFSSILSQILCWIFEIDDQLLPIFLPHAWYQWIELRQRLKRRSNSYTKAHIDLY